MPLLEESVSTVHALIFEMNGHRYVRDLGSRTGTHVNGKPVHQQLLELGDELRIGDTAFQYLAEADAAAAQEDAEEDLSGTATISVAEDDVIELEPEPAPARRTAPRPSSRRPP